MAVDENGYVAVDDGLEPRRLCGAVSQSACVTGLCGGG